MDPVPFQMVLEYCLQGDTWDELTRINKVAVGISKARLQPERLLVGAHGFCQVALVLEGISQIADDLREFRPGLQGPAIAFYGLFRRASFSESIA